MSLFNIEVKVEAGETVPLRIYQQLEHRLNNLQNLHYKQSLRADTTENNITSLLRELVSNNAVKDDEFLHYLQDKYKIISTIDREV